MKLDQIANYFGTTPADWVHGYLCFEPGAWIWTKGSDIICILWKLILIFVFKFNQGMCPWMAFAWIFFLGIFLIFWGGSVGQIIYREYIVFRDLNISCSLAISLSQYGGGALRTFPSPAPNVELCQTLHWNLFALFSPSLSTIASVIIKTWACTWEVLLQSSVGIFACMDPPGWLNSAGAWSLFPEWCEETALVVSLQRLLLPTNVFSGECCLVSVFSGIIIIVFIIIMFFLFFFWRRFARLSTCICTH